MCTQGERSRQGTMPRDLETMSLFRLYEIVQYFLRLEMKKIVSTEVLGKSSPDKAYVVKNILQGILFTVSLGERCYLWIKGKHISHS